MKKKKYIINSINFHQIPKNPRYRNGIGDLYFKNASAFLLRDARHAMHDILLLRISAILPEAISDGGLTPTTDTDLLLATYRGGSHLTSDIYINTKCCILPQIFELILSDWNKQNTGNVNRYKL